jgi:hypothetical protein
MTPVAIIPDHLEEAGLALRQVLLRLNQYAKGRVDRLDPDSRYATSTMNHVRDIDALMAAVQQYERSVMACLPAELAPEPTPDLSQLSAEQVLAIRQADPIYQMGYERGRRAGMEQEQRKHNPALQLYAKHAQLPAPPPEPTSDYDSLVTRVRRVLATMTERYGAGPIPRYQLPSRLHGTI